MVLRTPASRSPRTSAQRRATSATSGVFELPGWAGAAAVGAEPSLSPLTSDPQPEVLQVTKRVAITCALLLLALALALPTTAAAAGRQLTILQDDFLVLRAGDGTRQWALDEFRALGADVVKVQMLWREVAPSPNSPRKPRVNLRDPANYDFSRFDAFVREAVARGLRPYIAIGGQAPRWASQGTRAQPGSSRPDPRSYRDFVHAVGLRYSGRYAGIPRVSIWSAWNEPNLLSWLGPQRSRSGVPLAPTIYRRLYQAFVAGMQSSGHSRDTLLFGELVPFGSSSRRSATRISPIEFLRETFCLDANWRPYRGAAAKARGCGRLGRLRVSGIAYHPYVPRGGLYGRLPSRDDASIAQLGRLTSALDKLARRGKLPPRLPIWITEYGFQTNPPDPFQFPISRVPSYMDESEWLAFRNPRVVSYSQYLLVDEAARKSRSALVRWSGFQQGLRFADGREKPGVYQAFRFPVFVREYRRDRVEVFGRLRPRRPGTRVVIAVSAGNGYRQVASVRINSAGYFRKTLPVSSASKRKFRIVADGLVRIKRAVRR